MKGHVRKRGSKWAFVLDIGRDPETGKRKQKWFSGFKTKREAERAMAEKVAEVSRGEYIEPSTMEVKEFFHMWLKEEVKPNRSDATFDLYKSFTNQHIIPGLGGIPLNKLTTIHVHQFLNALSEKGVSHTTSKYILRTVKVALNWALNMQLIPKNPAANLQVSAQQSGTGIKVWSREEVNHFLKAARNSKFYAAFYLAVTTGMRIGEILGLKWEDVDLDRGVVSIRRILQRTSAGIKLVDQTKTAHSRRSVNISPTTVDVLKSHQVKQKEEMIRYNYRDADLVFTSRNGNPIEPRNLRVYFKKIAKQVDLPLIRFHDLRHTHATLLLQQGVHPKIVSERLGHASISMTLDTYSHVIPSMQKEAADTFDQILGGDKRG
jgi:integrase